MSKLFECQVKFGRMLPKLLNHIHDQGYLYTIGQTVRCVHCEVGHRDSLHKKGLAVDINLFDKDKTYLKSGEAHRKMHEFWDTLGGSKIIEGDENHYSIAYQNMR